MMRFELDTTSPAFAADPYPTYDMIRGIDPLLYWQEKGFWLVTGHDACERLQRDRRIGQKAEPGNPMLFQNPPDHTRLRRLVNHAFARRRVEELKDRVQELADSLIDAFADRSEADLVAEFAKPLPALVIGELMGVPEEDRNRFLDSAPRLLDTFDPTHDEAAAARSLASQTAFTTYLHSLFEERRARPGNDLLSALVQAETEGERLTEVELYTMCILLIAAGHVTVVNLIANGVLALLRNPDQMALLQEREDLTESAVDEFLRYDSPLQVSPRIALESFEFEGRRLKEGDVLALFLGAANRDPAAFDRPGELDITRADNRHVAFGSGIHRCLGAPLARLEGRIAIPTILRRLPDLALAADELAYPESFVLRGPVAMPVTFRAGR